MPYSQYPARWRAITLGAWLFVLVFNLAEYLLEWVRAFYTFLAPLVQWPPNSFLVSSPGILHPLLTAHLGLLVALVVVRAVAFLTPRVSIGNNQLYFKTALGTRSVPFDALRGIRSIEMEASGRFVVWIDAARGLPLHSLIGSLLFGRWFRSGLLLTSDLSGFDQIVGAVVGQLKTKYGEADFAAHYSEEPATWLVKMLTTPGETVRQVAKTKVSPLTERDMVVQAISFTTCMLVPALVAGIIHLQIPWGGLIAAILAVGEWLMAGLYLTAVPLEPSQTVEIRDALRIYPLTQMPRWIVAAVFTLLIAAGAPAPLLLIAAFLAIVLGCNPVLSLTHAWFNTHLPESLLGVFVSAVFQFLTYLIFVISLPH